MAVSGSDTSANALLGALQVTAARESGLSPELLAGRERGLLRKVLPWMLPCPLDAV